MPDQVIPVTGLSDVGLIADIPPVAIPPNGFSDCRNVRFRNGSAQKMKGDIEVFPYIELGADDVIKYCLWWPNPNLSIFNQGYYVLMIQQGANDNAYVLKVGETGTAEEPLVLEMDSQNYKGSFEPGGNWQHTFFQGGFALVVNNGLETPQYILDSEDNVNVGGVPDFAELPGWHSYAVEGTTVTDVTAGVIRSYGDFLVAGNLVERDADNEIVRALPSVVRTSDIAAPGGIPQNWNPFADGVNTADEFVITTDGIVQDFVELQGKMYVYSNSSISVISRTGSATIPFSVQPVTPAYGAMTTDSVIEFDGRHFVVGAQDIYIFGGHPGSIQSVGEDKIRRYFYDNLSVIDIDQVFCLRYQQEDEIWVCYPSQTAVGGRADEALIWNYRNNTWTKRDIQQAYSGVIGPVPGGGLPEAEIEFDGTAVPSTVDEGQVHVITVTDLTNIEMTGDGTVFSETIDLSNIPQAESSGDPTVRIIINPDFYTGGEGDEPSLRFILRVDSLDGDELTSVNICLPAGIGGDIDEDYNTLEWQNAVLDVLIGAIVEEAAFLDGYLTLARVSDPESLQYVAFDIIVNSELISNVFDEDNVSIVLNIAKSIDVTRESDLAIKDRPVTDGVIDNTIDREGHIIYDMSSPNFLYETETSSIDGGQVEAINVEAPDYNDNGTVFTYDFSELWDTLDDYIFFFKGERVGFAFGYNNFIDLEGSYLVYTGILEETETETELDGVFNTFEAGATSTHIPASLVGPDGNQIALDTGSLGIELETFNGGIIRYKPSDLDDESNPPVPKSIVSIAYAPNVSVAFEFFTEAQLANVSIVDGNELLVESDDFIDGYIYIISYLYDAEYDENDGHSRLNTDFGVFTNGVIASDNTTAQLENNGDNFITGTQIKDAIARSGIEGNRRLDFYIVDSNRDDPEQYEHLGLLAYEIPKDSDGNPDFQFETIGTALMHFNFFDGVFNKANNAWEKGEPLDPLSVLLTYNMESDTDNTRQNDAYATSIIETIKTAPLFTATGSDTDDDDLLDSVTITSVNNAPYFLEIEFEDLIEKKDSEDDPDVPIEWDPTWQDNDSNTRGLYPYDNIGEGRQIVAPCIQISHTDPYGIDFFSFQTPVIELKRPVGNDPFTIQEQRDLINQHIQAAVPNQWRYDPDGVWTSRSIRYNESMGDTGVPRPNEDGTYNFPEEREGVNFAIDYFSGGITTNTKPTFTITTQGRYPSVTMGSYFTMALSDGVNYLFPVTGTNVAQSLRPEILQRIPELQVELVNNNAGLQIIPAVIGHNSVFLQEAFFNTTSTIDDFNRLLNPENYTQDDQNVTFELSLPFAVLEDQNQEFESIDGGPLITESNITTNFDVDRTWSESQVDFSYEFPIFAAGRTFTDGDSINGVLASEIGWTFPEFTRDGIEAVSYESFIERDQMALSPEFETEHLYGIALWADGSSRREFQGEYQYNVLQLNLSTTDNPGQRVDLSQPQMSNTHYISEDYKMDTRLTGRFLNWNLTDNVTGTLESPGGKTFSQDTEWRISGIQLKIRTAGRR